MQEKTNNQQLRLRFHRFSRKNYAVYNSLHREVTIGTVATHIANRSLHKTLCSVALCTALTTSVALAQTDRESGGRQLPVLEISAQADTLFGTPDAAVALTAADIQSLTIRSVGDLVALLPGVDLRSRGGNDVQGDLSMRGSTFDQMAVLLNGVNFTDAQTGHHNLDIPIDIAMVQRVELLTAADLLSRGVMGFAGGVNIVVNEEYADHLRAMVEGGSFGQAKVSVAATKTLGPWALTAAASYNRSDGYTTNTDYRYANLFLQASRHGQRDDWHLQLGGQTKDFGSQAFYSTKYPDQFEATRTAEASVFNIHRFGRSRLETVLYGRLHKDRFELFRETMVSAPDWYSGHNHHLSNSEGLRSRWSAEAGPGVVVAGLDLRRDAIASNVLGDSLATPRPPYTLSATRLGTSLFGGYDLNMGNLGVSARLLANHTNSFGFDYGAALSAQYAFSRRLKAAATLSRTFRLPSFTDLYYTSATQLSNPDLEPENTINAEASVSYNSRSLRVVADLYWRSGRQIIDWVRMPNETVWHSMNHTAVGALGADLQAVWTPQQLPITVGAAYSYCQADRDAGELVSNYALDYLRHKGELFITYSPIERLTLRASLTVRQREGHYTDENGQLVDYAIPALLNASAEYDFGRVAVFAEGYNLLDAQYCDYGGVPQPGISVMAGLKLNLH